MEDSRLLAPSFVAPGLEIRMRQADWRGPVRFSVRPRRNHLHLNLPPIAYRGQARFPELDPKKLAPIGRSYFRPSGYLIESEGTGGRSFSLRCSVTQDRTRQVLGDDPDWSARNLDKTTDLSRSPIMPLLLRMAHEMRQPALGHATMMESLANQSIVELWRFLEPLTQSDEDRGRLNPAQLHRIEERVCDRSLPPPSVSELARISDMSERHLLRLFQATSGMSVSAYVRAELTERACEMLEQDRLPIKQIAHSLGFSGPSSFSQAFRNSIGTSPGSYRSELRARLVS